MVDVVARVTLLFRDERAAREWLSVQTQSVAVAAAQKLQRDLDGYRFARRLDDPCSVEARVEDSILHTIRSVDRDDDRHVGEPARVSEADAERWDAEHV